MFYVIGHGGMINGKYYLYDTYGTAWPVEEIFLICIFLALKGKDVSMSSQRDQNWKCR